MKNKLKKVFENAIWWSGVIMVGLILGISLQFVKAWTEPAQAPPEGNVGAPLNTSAIAQLKNGVLGVLGLTTNSLRVNPASGNPTGQVLTGLNPSGDVTWAAMGGITFTQYCYNNTDQDNNWLKYNHGKENCTNVGGEQGHCPVGFKEKMALGNWGYCFVIGAAACYSDHCMFTTFLPPGAHCGTSASSEGILGQAYVCSQ